MRSGRLKQRLTIQTPTRTANGVGESIMTWTDTHNIWCDVRPVTARETQRSSQPIVDYDHVITCRYNRWLQSDYRLKWARQGQTTRYFNIKGIIDVEEKHREFEISASEARDV